MYESLFAVPLLFVILASFAVVVLLSLLYVVVRRRRRESAPEWLEVRRYAEMKALSQDQWLILAAMLKRYAPDSAFETVTYRHEFDRCVCDQLANVSNMSQREKMGEILREIREALDLVKVPDGARWTSTLDLEKKATVKARPLEQEKRPMADFYLKHINDAYFYLMPRNAELMADITEGSRFLMHICRDGDARYEVVASVAALRSNPPSIMFGHVHEMKRMQMRAHERSAFTRPTPIELFVVPEDWAHDPLAWLTKNEPVIQGSGTFMNISAGGFAAMLAGGAPPTHAFARVKINLGSSGTPPFACYAHIVDAVSLAQDRTLLRAAFIDITTVQQQAIDQYVAEVKKEAAPQEELPEAEEEAEAAEADAEEEAKESQ